MTMSKELFEMICAVSEERFGPKVVDVMGQLKWTAKTLAEIARETNMDTREAKSILSLLVQFGLVSFKIYAKTKSNVKNSVKYYLDPDYAFSTTRYAKYALAIKNKFHSAQPAAIALIRELILSGIVKKSDLVSEVKKELENKVTNNMREKYEKELAQMDESNDPNYFRKKTILEETYGKRRNDELTRLIQNIDAALECLLIEKYVINAPLLTGNDVPRGGSRVPPPKKEIQKTPSEAATKKTRGRPKKKKTNETIAEIVVEESTPTSVAPLVDDEYLCLSHARFNQHLRDVTIIEATCSRFNKECASLMSVLLELGRIDEDENTWPERSCDILLADLREALSADGSMDSRLRHKLLHGTRDYLQVLEYLDVAFVSNYEVCARVNYKLIIDALALECISLIIKQRFDEPAVMVFRSVLANGYCEITQIEKMVIMRDKAVKTYTHRLLEAGFLEYQDVKKSSAKGFVKCFFLYHVNLYKTASVILKQCYKSGFNVLMKKKELSGAEDDFELKVENDIAGNVLENTLEEKEKLLGKAESGIDDAIMLLEFFLKYQ